MTTRKILPFISDYFADVPSQTVVNRKAHYEMLKRELGVHTVRIEFRIKDLMKNEQEVDQDVFQRYVDSLIAITESGMSAPVIVLFSPPKWMINLSKKNPKKLDEFFERYCQNVRGICEKGKCRPKFVQVMSELNWFVQTPFSLETVVRMIKITAQVFDYKETKIMSTISMNSNPHIPFAGKQRETIRGKFLSTMPYFNDWKSVTRELVTQTDGYLDAVGFDYYPGSYESPVGVPYFGRQGVKAFSQTDGYEWIAKEKIQTEGILHDKEILIAEIGVPGFSKTRFLFNQEMQCVGYNSIFAALNGFLSKYEAQGIAAEKIFSAVGIFCSVELDLKYVNYFAPFALDFIPWTLIRPGKGAGWQITKAGKCLKGLIDSVLWTKSSG